MGNSFKNITASEALKLAVDVLKTARTDSSEDAHEEASRLLSEFFQQMHPDRTCRFCGKATFDTERTTGWTLGELSAAMNPTGGGRGKE